MRAPDIGALIFFTLTSVRRAFCLLKILERKSAEVWHFAEIFVNLGKDLTL